MEVTNPLAGFAANLKYADLPAAVVAKTKQLITDCLGNQIGAVYEESGKTVLLDRKIFLKARKASLMPILMRPISTG